MSVSESISEMVTLARRVAVGVRAGSIVRPDIVVTNSIPYPSQRKTSVKITHAASGLAFRVGEKRAAVPVQLLEVLLSYTNGWQFRLWTNDDWIVDWSQKSEKITPWQRWVACWGGSPRICLQGVADIRDPTMDGEPSVEVGGSPFFQPEYVREGRVLRLSRMFRIMHAPEQRDHFREHLPEVQHVGVELATPEGRSAYLAAGEAWVARYLEARTAWAAQFESVPSEIALVGGGYTVSGVCIPEAYFSFGIHLKTVTATLERLLKKAEQTVQANPYR